MTEYPWYDEISPDEPLMQGDLLDSCPVLVFDQTPAFGDFEGIDAMVDALDDAHGVQRVRVIVMTQACDLAENKVRNAILCPVYHRADYQAQWEQHETSRGQNPTPRAFTKTLEGIRDGRTWNLTMLAGREAPGEAGLSIPIQIVDFHEVFSLPVDFLNALIRASGKNRLRLRPPYREHLSQAFARFFMRVGLPVNIALQ